MGSCVNLCDADAMQRQHKFGLEFIDRGSHALHVLNDAPPILPILKIGLVVAQAHVVDAEVERRVNFQRVDGVGLLHEPQFLITRCLGETIKNIAFELDLLVAVLAHFCTSAAMSCAAAYSAGVSALTCAKRRRPARPMAGRTTSASGRPRMGSQTSLVSAFGPESRIIVHASIGHNFPQ